MMIGVGIMELVLVAAALLTAIVLWLLRSRAVNWGIAAVVGLAAATLTTPADPLSTLLLGGLFVVFYAAGSQWGRKPSDASS